MNSIRARAGSLLTKRIVRRDIGLCRSYITSGDSQSQDVFPKGFPFDTPLLNRMNRILGQADQADKTLIIERENYDSRQRLKKSYRMLAADILAARVSFLNSDESAFDYFRNRSKNGYSIGLIAGRNYEFVVNLLSLISAGYRPALINPRAKAAEIDHIMKITDSEYLMVPKENTFNSTSWETSYNIISRPSELGAHCEESPLGIDDMQEELKSDVEVENKGIFLSTSGTTGNPKGVFTNINAVSTQCQNLVKAWKYSTDDHILHVLPTYHIHGLVNSLLAPLSAGTSLEFVDQPFNPLQVLERIAASPTAEFPQITMFHGVPTMYASFVSTYESLPSSQQDKIRDGLRRLRVAVCGSAALPVPIAEKWQSITGTIPLERYGMTEIGMALSNPLEPSGRILGSVGKPINENIEAQIIDSKGNVIPFANTPGELAIKWDHNTIFTKYWNNTEETRKAECQPKFIPPDQVSRVDSNGDITIASSESSVKHETQSSGAYFQTGDVAMRGEKGEFYILGRKSADIIKVAGHKVSALEIEREILGLPEISEAVVVGVPNQIYGEIPEALIVLKHPYKEKLSSEPKYRSKLIKYLRKKAGNSLSEEKRPRRWIIVDSIPRNAMGKVNKKQLLENRDLFKGVKGDR